MRPALLVIDMQRELLDGKETTTTLRERLSPIASRQVVPALVEAAAPA